MLSYLDMTPNQLIEEKNKVSAEYKRYVDMNLKLDISRGKPGAEQIKLSSQILDVLSSKEIYEYTNAEQIMNYGIVDGLPEVKKLFADMLGVDSDEIFVGGNASLSLMYDMIARAMQFGFADSKRAWGKEETIKWLCPAPGYDRHFAISELFGMQMINIPMLPTGPDMDMVEKLVAEDDTIKGIWCVPVYSNPQGITYSDETVKRFANLKPKAPDFKIFWDNAYCIHHLTDTPKTPLNLMSECKKAGTEDMAFMFASTSKISIAGSGIAAFAASKKNMDFLLKQISVQTIGYDKINQLRHIKYFGDINGVNAHMQKHKEILKPKFEKVLGILDKRLKPLNIASFNSPEGGYFISLDTLEGCAKRTVELCKGAGVNFTPAGATYPYGKDPYDKNIRIAPTMPTIDELETAIELMCVCVKLASLEKLTA